MTAMLSALMILMNAPVISMSIIECMIGCNGTCNRELGRFVDLN